jgi:predicted 3-demethylubiquinone-9 3-methyltransferase (glyoxalase superfamily)
VQKIIPTLWFDNEAEEAANYYISIFKNSKILNITRYGEASAEVSGKPKGSVMTVNFKIEDQEFIALNGGPEFKFSEAVSFLINCKDQNEVDYYWEKLTSGGGQESVCGWLKDKYGVSWQVVPTVLDEMIQDKDTKKAERVMRAMLEMKKIEIKALEETYKEK